MTDLPFVYYLNKKNNPPHYYAGKELHTVEYDRGWVEYLTQSCDLYFTKLNQDLLDRYRYNAVSYIETLWDQQKNKHYSLLNQLANTRIEKPFDLPLFADWRQGSNFTCGSTRFTAEILCGTPSDQIPVFFQTNKGQRPVELDSAIPVLSTAQAEELSGISDCEYRLTFAQSRTPTVMATVLRNTIYEADSDYSTFEENGVFISNFWKKFTQDGKINLVITCHKNTKDLIEFSPHMWNVQFELKEMHGFSFGEVLAKFNQPNPDSQLNLFVYDIKNTFNLAYLLPWVTTNSVWYHTLNKKINLFDTTRGSATACWPIVSMGNFVQ